MSILYSDLLDIMLPRMERLGLLAPGEQKADATEAELYLFNALLEILEVSDIPAYLTYNDHMVETSVGDASYPLPDDFGRLILPRVRNKRGLYLFDQARTTDLEYLDPNTFHRQTPAHTRNTYEVYRHRAHTLALSRATRQCPPQFHCQGTYVMQAVRPDLSDRSDFYPIPLPSWTWRCAASLVTLVSKSRHSIKQDKSPSQD